MLSQHFLNTQNGRYVIDYLIGFNLNCEAFKFDITLEVATDITKIYITHLYKFLGILSMTAGSLIGFNQEI